MVNNSSSYRWIARAVLSTSLLAICASTPVGVFAAPSASKTYSYVVTSFMTAVYETTYMDECPDGLAIDNDSIWWKSHSLVERGKLADMEHGFARSRASVGRGPHGEDVCWNPTVVQDPPLRTVKGKTSYGANLDGTADGHATKNSCAHQKFTGPNGEPGIDNQFYRMVGCIYGWRKDGFLETSADTERKDTSQGVTLIEVSGR